MAHKIQNLEEAVECLQRADDRETYDNNVKMIRQYLKHTGANTQTIKEFEESAKYFPNEYSEQDTKKRIVKARERAITYLAEFADDENNDSILIQVLENYDLFWGNFVERKPHKSAGIKKEQLECLKIENEYDLQHILYAYLMPLFPEARTEVSEDTGYATVRPDIYLGSKHIIEVKCTRTLMREKKLMEEIEADITHYSAENIYFFIYDRAKIIQNIRVFKETYENITQEKNIHVIIHQPKNL